MSASTGETELAAKGCPNTMVVQCLVLHDPLWRGGRVVCGSGLENRLRLQALKGFWTFCGSPRTILGPFSTLVPEITPNLFASTEKARKIQWLDEAVRRLRLRPDLINQ